MISLESFLSRGHRLLQWWQSIAQPTYYTVGVFAAIFAVRTYRKNSKLERARWAVQLYEKFYEAHQYTKVRDTLDCDADVESVQELVSQEESEFTDYLNFFELVAFLAYTHQLSRDDVLRLFQYYMSCLKRHSVVMKYINDRTKGFEQLRSFLATTQLQ